MLGQGQVGPQVSNDGATPAMRLGRSAEVVVQELHGRYYETARRGALFYASVAAVALTSLNATATGLILWNPNNSGVNMVLQKAMVQVIVTSASMTSIGFAFGVQAVVPTSVTAVATTGSCYLANNAGNVKAYSAATLAVAPGLLLNFAHNTAAIATTGVDGLVTDFEGSIVVPSGYALVLNAGGAASAASAVNATVLWEEVPL